MRLVIFDFDGTLADTRLNIVLTMRETMRELRLPEADEAACAATIGLRLRDGFARLLTGVADETLDRCVSTYRRLFDERKRTMPPKPFPGAAELLDALRGRGALLAIASSRSSFTLAPMLRDMGLAGAFDAVVCGDDAERPKPAPDAVLAILRPTPFSRSSAGWTSRRPPRSSSGTCRSTSRWGAPPASAPAASSGATQPANSSRPPAPTSSRRRWTTSSRSPRRGRGARAD